MFKRGHIVKGLKLVYTYIEIGRIIRGSVRKETDHKYEV